MTETTMSEQDFIRFIAGGRLMFRVIGDRWEAYFGTSDTNETIFLGSIAMAVIEARKDRKEEFMAFIKEVLGDLVEEVLGCRPDWPHAPVPAGEEVKELANAE